MGRIQKQSPIFDEQSRVVGRISMSDGTNAAQRQVANRWTPRLASLGWTPVADYFLQNYHRLKISALEAMVIIHLMSFKWDNAAPFPAIRTIGKRMGLTSGSVRAHLRRLGNKGLVLREMTIGGTNRFHLYGLFKALEDLIDADEKSGKAVVKKVRVELIARTGGIGKIVGFIDFLYGTDGITDVLPSSEALLSDDAISRLREYLSMRRFTGEIEGFLWHVT
jgi:predicted transcriptional regulator